MFLLLQTWAGWRGAQRSPQRDPPVKSKGAVTQLFPAVLQAVTPRALTAPSASLRLVTRTPVTNQQWASGLSLVTLVSPGDPAPAWPHHPPKNKRRGVQLGWEKESETKRKKGYRKRCETKEGHSWLEINNVEPGALWGAAQLSLKAVSKEKL